MTAFATLVVALAMLAACDAPDVTFTRCGWIASPAVPPPAIGSPGTVGIVDVNRDGKPDLVVSDNGAVGVLLGNGNGTFQPRVDYPAPLGAGSLTAVDVSGDGEIDLVMIGAPGLTGVVTVMLGNGNGTFRAGASYQTTGFPDALATADVDGDGRLDVVVVSAWGGSVSVLLGNGDGTFQASLGVAMGGSPESVAVADVNGDGKLDLLAANGSDSTVSVLLGQGDGTFHAARDYPTHVPPTSVVVADLNGDRTPDVVVISAPSLVSLFGGTTGVMLGKGDGTLEAESDVSAAVPSAVAVADMNHDGVPDLVTTSGETVDVLMGNGDGTFRAQGGAPTGIFPEPDLVALAVADLNGDGALDIVAVDRRTNTLGVLLARCIP